MKIKLVNIYLIKKLVTGVLLKIEKIRKMQIRSKW